MGKIYDISLPLTAALPVWPGDPPLHIERVNQLENGDIANVSYFRGGLHVGTHIDAPFHFIDAGGTVDQIPFDRLVGDVQVIDVGDSVELVTQRVLERVALQPPIDKILIKTRNSKFWEAGINAFQKDFVGLSPDGAAYLVGKGVQLVGIDYLSIAPFDSPTPTHITLLEANVVILEGLNLAEILPGRYELICLPLNIPGAEGAFARAVLRAYD